MLSSVLSTTTEADIVKTPFAYARVTLSKMEYIELKAQANQWHSQWLRARQREREALAQIAQIKVKHQKNQAISKKVRAPGRNLTARKDSKKAQKDMVERTSIPCP